MFNFFARTASEYSFETVANLFLNMIYLITPWGVYFLYKARKNFVNSDLLKLLVSILSLMFVIFFIVSLKNDLGIQLRYLQTLSDISSDKTNTIVFPFSTELNNLLKGQK